MFKYFRFFRNILYLFKAIRETGDSPDKIFYKCLKCKSELEGFKNYGKLNVVCKCGNISKVYTGKNIYLKKSTDENNKLKLRNKLKKVDSEKERRLKNFENYLNSDFRYLYNIISNKRDITRQVNYEQCESLLSDDDDERYYDIVKYLQKFFELDSASIKITWEPIYHQKKLLNIESNLHIVGTTYFMPLTSFIYYSIYLNSEFTWNHKLMIATIAHEMSHIYASFNKIQFKTLDAERGDLEIQEQMTDLLGIVLGVGELMCIEAQEGDESFNTCYLTNNMIRKSNYLWQKEYLSGKNENIKTLVVCNQCSQKLRIPIVPKTLIITCPRCKNKFEFSK